MTNHETIKQAFGGLKAPGRVADAVLNDTDLFEPLEGGSLHPAQTDYPQASTRARVIGTVLAACMLAALIAVPVWVVNGNGLFGGGAPGAGDGPAKAAGWDLLPQYGGADAWELLVKYGGADHENSRTGATTNAFTVDGPEGTLREGRTYTGDLDLQSFLDALEGAGFLFPLLSPENLQPLTQ